jgi:hypothetical protein
VYAITSFKPKRPSLPTQQGLYIFISKTEQMIDGNFTS